MALPPMTKVNAHLKAQHMCDFAQAHWPKARMCYEFRPARNDEVIAAAVGERSNSFEKSGFLQFLGL